MFDKIVIAFATRFKKPVTVVRRHVKIEHVEQWGRVRRLEGGDDMYASSLVKAGEDYRDATYIRVSSSVLCSFELIAEFKCQYDMLVDIYARQARRDPKWELQSFFGQLQNILEVRLPSIPDLDLPEPTVYILAGIRACELEAKNALKMPYYSKTSRYEVVDMTCVQCLVARIAEDASGTRWAIADRSNNISRSYYVEDEPQPV